MTRILRTLLPALAAFAGFTSSANAQVSIQVPFVTVQAGNGGVYVRAPFVTLQIPRSVVAAPPAAPLPPQTERIGDPIPVPLPKPGQTDFSVPVPLPRPAVARPMTHREFAATFKPAPGNYEVLLIHPVTEKPVLVSFTLPNGTVRKVRSWPRRINFDYGGRRDISIRFLADGSVRVME